LGQPVDEGLTDVEANRYARQIVLKDIGWEGQIKLKHSTVLVAGAGGLGSPILIQLASLGVGTIKIIDRDIVSVTDLHRQYLYRETDAGRPKMEVAVKRIKEINSTIKVEGYAESISYDRLLQLLKGVSVLMDGLDDMKGRYALNRAGYKMKVPYVFSSALEMYGNVSTIIPGETPCLECFLGGVKDDGVRKCAVVGVHPSLLGVISSVAISEAVKIITGRRPSLASKLLLIDLRHFSFDSFEVTSNPNCPVSGTGTNLSDIRPPLLERACARDGSGTYFINPGRTLDLDLGKLDAFAREKGYAVLSEGDVFRTLRLDELYDVSVLKSGTAMFKVKKPVLDIDVAEAKMKEIYEEIVEDGLSVSWNEYLASPAQG
jgi:molybdopterin/thiamine biosynthesis adenylyltransferase